MSLNITNVPFHTSVPLQVIGRVSAPLVGGNYTFAGRPNEMSPKESFTDNALYVMTKVSIACDVSNLDYQGAIVKVPEINFYSTGEARAPLVRKPIQAPVYYEAYDYTYAFQMKKDPSSLLFSVKGVIEQTPELLGKQELTFSVISQIYEIVDDDFIADFKKKWSDQRA